MYKNSKIILHYPQFQNIIIQYQGLDEFKDRAPDTIHSKHVTITALCNYLGDGSITSFAQCMHNHVADFMQSISSLSSTTKSGKAFILRHFFNFLYKEIIILYSGNELFPVIITEIISYFLSPYLKRFAEHIKNSLPRSDIYLRKYIHIRGGKLHNMYRQQSLITLDYFYEMKPLTKLEAILSFVDFSMLENTFPNSTHKRGPKDYFKKQLLSVLLAMQTEQRVHLKALVQKLKSDPMFKRSCGFGYFDQTPSEATLSRFIAQLSNTNLLEHTYRSMIHKANSLGLIDGHNVVIDASKITSY